MAKRKRKKMKPDEIDRFTMRLPPQLHAELRTRAQADGRTLSNYVRRVLEEHVKATSAPAPLAAVA